MKKKKKIPVAFYRVDCSNYGKVSCTDIVEDIIGQINQEEIEHHQEFESSAFAKEGFNLKIYSSPN